MSTPGPGRLPATVIALGLTSLLTDVASEMIYPLLPVFVATLGGAPALLGLIEGVAEAIASLLKLVSGRMSDRAARRRPLVLAGYGLAALVRPLMALASAPWHVLAIRATDRVGKGVRTAPRDALIADAVPADEAGRAFGFHRAMDHAGAVIGPLLALALLAGGASVRTVFWLAAIPGVLGVLAVLRVREPEREVPVAAPGVAGASAPMSSPLRRYLVVLGLFALGNSSDAFLLLRAGELGVAVRWMPLLWLVLHVVKLTSSYLGGGWADRVPRTRLIIAGWVVYAATYVGFALASATWHVWALFVVYGVYYGLTEPAEKALVRDLAPAAARGRAYGAYHFVIGITAVPAGLLTGGLWQGASGRVALLVGAGLALAAALALAVGPSTSARSARAGGAGDVGPQQG